MTPTKSFWISTTIVLVFGAGALIWISNQTYEKPRYTTTSAGPGQGEVRVVVLQDGTRCALWAYGIHCDWGRQ